MGIRSMLDAQVAVLGPLARAHELNPSLEDFARAYAVGFARSGSGGQMVQVVPDRALVRYLAGHHSAGLRLSHAG
ncbi:hypothetical protein [Sanguibacter sp. Z1732]|uniref:hypothetical protein n=1 Tax=Sanguibacter sp. Z1732 TaxID=3435412 RepID=UPI003D9CB899